MIKIKTNFKIKILKPLLFLETKVFNFVFPEGRVSYFRMFLLNFFLSFLLFSLILLVYLALFN
jgi:hypothetical protein